MIVLVVNNITFDCSITYHSNESCTASLPLENNLGTCAYHAPCKIAKTFDGTSHHWCNHLLRTKLTILTTVFSVLIDLTCWQSSTPRVVLLASPNPSALPLACFVWASFSPFPLGGWGLGGTSPRCFLVTCASGPWTVFTCFLRELGSV